MNHIVAFTALLASLALCLRNKSEAFNGARSRSRPLRRTWHEIARYPNWFQRDCKGGAIADYTPVSARSINVVNSCRRADGSMKSIVGRATVVPGSGNARLKVRFFGPFSGNYWIIGLDEKNYSLALVGHPSRRFLWILSRKSFMSDELYRKIVGIAVREGYSAERVVRLAPARVPKNANQ